jgi:serine/threonine-protein kinase
VNDLDWRRLRAHFEALCDLPEAQRGEAIQALQESPEMLARLQRMLDADAAERLSGNVTQLAPELVRRAADPGQDPAGMLGQRLGPWRIVAFAGAGGMGHVYRACRDDGRFETDAAIKIVASRLDAARFLHERAVLARLQHPGIARLLDGGETDDGRPYLVMEFVDGEQIDQWCARQQPTLAERVQRIVDAARAVAYAHARAVLHRDLKPANILIDGNAQVKLLDFGVAKLLDVEHSDPALTSARYFTPRYAAPEQLAGDSSTTATDVHALALVLYELLSGRHPFADESGRNDKGGLPGRVLSAEPLPLRRALPADAAIAGAPHRLRDLEAVLSRALQREPQQRYASMEAFADELQCVLEDRPVSTRAAGPLERSWRWARRHRLSASMAMIALLSLLLGASVALWQGIEARRQRDAALLEAARAERVGSFLADIFRAPNPARSRGAEVSAKELLDRGRERIADELGDDPILRERLQRVMADTYRSLGLYEASEALLVEALAAVEDAARRAELLSDLGWLHAFQGRYEESAMRLQESIALLRPGGASEALLTALQRLATPLINLNRIDEAETAAHEALSLDRSLDAPDLARQAGLQSLLGSVAYNRGDFAAAQARYEEALLTQRKLYGEGHTAIGVGLGNLATVAFRQGRLEQAVERYRETIALQRAYFGVDNAQVAAPMASLGLALRRLGRGAESLAALREAAAIHAAWSGAGHREALQVRLDALELALLLGADATIELAALSQAAATLEADSLNRCRWDFLRQQAASADLQTMQAALGCLEAIPAAAAVRAHAWLALATIDPSPTRIAAATAHIEALQPADALLAAALQALRLR